MTIGWLNWGVRSLLLGAIGSLGAISFLPHPTLAQLTEDTAPDRNLGTQVQQDFVPGVDVITGGTRPQNGINLFHSFQEFNIAPGRSAYFLLPDNGIQNVLARVTGLNPSQIEGTLGTRIFANGAFAASNANLFLINPNGIIFGQGARLDLGGSFVATTANAIQFGNQGFFSASNPDATPLLTINPSAFLFNQIAARPIINRSRVPNLTVPTFIDGLRVNDGLSLLLLGGDIVSDGGVVQARGGRIELAGIQGSGNVGLSVDGNRLDLIVPDNVPLADITLANQASLDTSGFANTVIPTGGEIQTHSANLTLSNTSSISSNTFGAQNGGTITLRATQVGLSNQSSINSLTLGAGNSGDIEVYTEQLQMQNSAQILTGQVGGTGNSGRIFIQANQSIDLQNNSQFGSLTFGRGDQIGTGNAGDIVIRTGNFNVQNGGGIITSTYIGDGDSGNIDIQARNISLANSNLYTSSVGLGASGSIAIKTGTLNLTQGSATQTSSFDVSTFDFNSLAGTAPPDLIALLIALRDTAPLGRLGQANSGDLSIEATDSVNISGTSVTGNRSRLTTETFGAGAGGRLTITTNNLNVLDGGSVSTSTTGSGRGGSLTVSVAGTIEVAGTSGNGIFQSFLGSESTNTGNAGDVTVTAEQLLLLDGGLISASTFGQSRAGNLTVNTTNSIILDGTTPNGQFSSGIFSTVAQTADGEGGNVSVNTRNLNITNGAAVNASTFGKGNAGDVTVTAEAIALDGTIPNGQFSSGIFSTVAQTADGEGGNVSVNTRNLTITNGAVVSASTGGKGSAGDVAATAENIALDGTTPDGQDSSGIFSAVAQTADGDGGNVSINTRNLTITNGAAVNASTFGKGNAGDVTVTAEAIALDGTTPNGQFGSGIFSTVNQTATGDGGNISLTTRSLIITNGAGVSASTVGNGTAGNVTIMASEGVGLAGGGIFTASLSSSLAGDITVTTPFLFMDRQGGFI